MLTLLRALSIISFAGYSVAQVADLPVPPKIVQEHAQDILSSTASSKCETACAQIAAKLPTQVELSPSLINYIWSAQQGELTPACRVEPVSAEEVALIYDVVRQQECHFAIKSGGHARSAGESNAHGGITIDLVKMNHVELSNDKKSVTVGAGSIWGDVYRAVEEHGLSVVGGRVADVGVGGLLTGGGMSYWSNRYGWACDNVLSYQIVLPTGESTKVDEKHHPDLYRSLRGAGPSNFGIITSFELKTIDLPNKNGIWQSIAYRGFDELDTLLDEQHQLLTEGTVKDLDAVFLNAFAYAAEYDSYLTVTMQYHVNHFDANTHPETFARYQNLKTVAPPDTRILPYSNNTELIKAMNPAGMRNAFATYTHRPSKEMDRAVVEIYQQGIQKIKNVTGVKTAVTVQPIYQNAMRLMSKRGGNALGLSSSADQGPLMVVLFPFSWQNAADDELVREAMQEMVSKGEARAKELGVYHPYKYINYAEGFQNAVVGYGEENLKELRKTQLKYDPEGIYAKGGLAGGSFKLNEKKQGEGVVGKIKKVVGKMKKEHGKPRDEL